MSKYVHSIAEIFWKKRHWKKLSKDALWREALAILINWLCYEPTKSLFFQNVHEELLDVQGRQRIDLWFPYSVVDLQRKVNAVPGHALEPADMVRLAKKIWRCQKSIKRHRSRKLNVGRQLRMRAGSLRMYGLRRAYRRTAQKVGR